MQNDTPAEQMGAAGAFLVSQANRIACSPPVWNKGVQMKASVKAETVMSGGGIFFQIPRKILLPPYGFGFCRYLIPPLRLGSVRLPTLVLHAASPTTRIEVESSSAGAAKVLIADADANSSWYRNEGKHESLMESLGTICPFSVTKMGFCLRMKASVKTKPVRWEEIRIY
jgi:hypothetical protein